MNGTFYQVNDSKILCLETGVIYEYESNEIYTDNRPMVFISGDLSLIGEEANSLWDVLKTLCSSHTWKESE